MTYCLRILIEVIKDLRDYYWTPYPFLLILGAFRRMSRRFRIIWLAKPKGRPPVHENVVDLIIEMKRCNSIWGARRISDELKLMGIDVSKKTVLKILRENGFVPPRTRFAPPSWSSVFDSLRRHWAMDFTTVFDGKGRQIFIFAIIEVPSRKLILINSTTNPTKKWLIQQFRNCCISGNIFPAAMVHDRDGIFGHWLPDILEEFGCQSVKTPPRSPWKNPHIERFFRSLKEELLNRIVLVDCKHIQEQCFSYLEYFNSSRPHQGIDGKIPTLVTSRNAAPSKFDTLRAEKTLRLNGLVTQFSLAG